MTGLLELGRALLGRGAPESTTPRAAVHREGSLTLWRYERPGMPRGESDRGSCSSCAATPDTAAAPGAALPPVVLVYSLINRPSVLDLTPDRSVARSLLAAGLDVYLADWGEPGREESRMDLAAHVLRLERAVRAACADAGSERASLLGYCLGGTLAVALAAHAPSLVARVGLLATPVAFQESGLLGAWARTPGLDPAALACSPAGNVPGVLARELLRFQDPVGQWKKWTALAERAFDRDFVPGFLAQEAWANDCVDLPGRAFADVIRLLYREDRLAKGTLEVAGRALLLDAITAPLLSVISEGDRIVPNECSLPLAALCPRAEVETLRVSGGHIGMTVGRRAPATTHAALARFFARQSQ